MLQSQTTYKTYRKFVISKYCHVNFIRSVKVFFFVFRAIISKHITSRDVSRYAPKTCDCAAKRMTLFSEHELMIDITRSWVVPSSEAIQLDGLFVRTGGHGARARACDQECALQQNLRVGHGENAVVFK